MDTKVKKIGKRESEKCKNTDESKKIRSSDKWKNKNESKENNSECERGKNRHEDKENKKMGKKISIRTMKI